MENLRPIDVHHHFGVSPLDEDDTADSFEDRVQRHVRAMDLSDISQALVMAPPNYPIPKGLEDTRAVNDTVARVHEEYPERFPVAVGTVEPAYGEAGLDEVDRMFEELDLDGIMWHNLWQKATPDAPIMYDLIERAATHDAFVIMHSIAGNEVDAPWRVLRVVEDFPDTEFIVLDVFSSSPQADYARYRAPDLDNVVFDTAASAFVTRKIEAFVEEVGADKLVLGTDYYTGFPVRESPVVGEILATELDDDQKRAILEGNSRDLFGLE